jgi:hypothetical protein
MLSKKEDFDRFMADDDISAYVAILKLNLRDAKSQTETNRRSKKNRNNDFSSIKEFGLKLVENSLCDEICALYKIDKSYVSSIISALDTQIKKDGSTRIKGDSIVIQSTYPIFWKLHELANRKQKKQVLFIYDIILESGFDNYPDLNIDDYPNYQDISQCKKIMGWQQDAISIIKQK